MPKVCLGNPILGDANALSDEDAGVDHFAKFGWEPLEWEDVARVEGCHGDFETGNVC